MKTWDDLGIVIQFNVMDTATLRAAQKNPEKYRI
jgi:pyruvate-formate lyase